VWKRETLELGMMEKWPSHLETVDKPHNPPGDIFIECIVFFYEVNISNLNLFLLIFHVSV